MLPSLKALRYDRLSTSAISAGSTVADLTPSASDFAFTYAQVKAMYDSKTDSDSAFCRGVRYVRPQEPPNAVPVILKICKLQEQRPADSPNYVTRAEFDAEAAYARRASELNIGPPVYHISVVESSGEVYGYIAMRRFEEIENLRVIFETSRRMIKNAYQPKAFATPCAMGRCDNTLSGDALVNDIYDNFARMATAYQDTLKRMWNDARFMHMDLHTGNIYYHQGNVYLIDYGLVLERSIIDAASDEHPYTWSVRHYAEPIVITGVQSAYEHSAYDVISDFEYSQEFLAMPDATKQRFISFRG